MKAKTKIDMSLKTKKKKKKKKKKKSKRILPIIICGILSVLPLLSILGSLVEGATGVAKIINDSKAAQRQLDEYQHHNRVKKNRGVYLAPCKSGQSIALRKKSIDKMLKMSRE